MWWGLLFAFAGAAYGQDLIFPDPKVNIDYRAFGNVATDIQAKRKFLRAVTRSYIEQYIREFLSKNRIKENLFPNTIIDTALAGIDNLPDKVIMQADDRGYALLKAQMDQSAGFYYQHLIGAGKAESYKTEILKEIRAMEKRATDLLVTKDKEWQAAFALGAKRIDDFIAKVEARLTAIETKNGLAASIASQPAMAPPPGMNKSDKILVYCALGLSLVSLLLGLRRSG